MCCVDVHVQVRTLVREYGDVGEKKLRPEYVWKGRSHDERDDVYWFAKENLEGNRASRCRQCQAQR